MPAARRALSPTSTSPQLDAEVLLAHVTGLSRARLLARRDDPLSDEDAAQFRALIERRLLGEPVAYLTGHKEFYGLDMVVTHDVLVPRPETESIVEACLEALPKGEIRQLADIGTGSGAILVAVLANRPYVRGYGTEISLEALAVAQENCRRHEVEDRTVLLLGDLLQPLPSAVHVIAANLPYVPPGEAAPDVAVWEPQAAVFGGGADGADTIRRFLKEAPLFLLPGGTVVMETAHSQGTLVRELAQATFPGASVQVHKDLAGYDRIVVVKTK